MVNQQQYQQLIEFENEVEILEESLRAQGIMDKLVEPQTSMEEIGMVKIETINKFMDKNVE